jgi:uroporphyrinogen decarboxylase
MYQTSATSDKRRLLAALRGSQADRVPNFEVLVDNPVFSHVMGRPMAGHTLANIDAPDYIEFARRVGQDAVGLCFYDNPFFYEAEDGSLRRRDFRIRSRADLDRLLPATLDHLQPLFARLRDYRTRTRDTELALFALTGDFFTQAYDGAFGFDAFMLMLYDDPALVEDYLERHADYYARQVQALVDIGIDFLYIGDDLAHKGGTLIRPADMRRLWLPRMARVMAPALRAGIPVLYHSDGCIYDLLEDIVALGIGGLNPIEPYGMDIAEVRRRYPHLALFGNLDVGAVLSRGTPDTVAATARSLIDTVGRTGPMVMASSHSITPNVPPENFIAMIETAQSYGKY